MPRTIRQAKRVGRTISLDPVERPSVLRAVYPTALVDLDLTSGAAATSLTTTRASTAYAQNAAGVYSSFSSNVPRITDLGLLVEEARTNSFPNNSMQGVAAGSPGTTPTGWSVTGSNFGLTRTVVGTGTEDGIDYIDIRWAGTASSSSNIVIQFVGSTTIAAAQGQTWAISTFAKRTLNAGVAPGAMSIALIGYNSGGTLVELPLAPAVTPSASSLGNNRFGGAAALAQATTAYVGSYLFFGLTSGQIYDFTIRIGWPQLEQGASVTSPIRTTAGAATRAADYILVNNFSTWFSQTAGTIYAEVNVPAVTGTQTLVSADDGTSNERYTTRAASANLNGVIVDGGVAVASMASGTLAANTTTKTALAYAANDAAYTTNAATPTGDTSVTLPTPDRMQLGGRAGGTADFLNGFLRRFIYYVLRMNAVQMQRATT